MRSFAEITLCGVSCFVMQTDMGHFCGYVEVPLSHPWRREGYDSIDVEVHGGLTFAGTIEDDHGKKRYVVGFDCAHYMDVTQGEPPRWSGPDVIVWDAERVAQECAKLADQMRQVAA